MGRYPPVHRVAALAQRLRLIGTTNGGISMFGLAVIR
jgi:hypothetical protein